MTEPMYDQFVRGKEYRTKKLNIGIQIYAQRVTMSGMNWDCLVETKEEARLLDRLQKAIDLAVAKEIMGGDCAKG